MTGSKFLVVVENATLEMEGNIAKKSAGYVAKIVDRERISTCNYGNWPRLQPLSSRSIIGCVLVFLITMVGVAESMECKEENSVALEIGPDFNHLLLDRFLNESEQGTFFVPIRTMFDLCKKGDLELLKTILSASKDKNPQDKCDSFLRNNTLLHVAAEKGHLDIVKIIIPLIDDKNPARMENSFNDTPLHLAAYKGHLEVFKYIFGKVQDKNPIGYWRGTPLYTAARNGHLDIVKYLFECLLKLKLTKIL